MIRPELGLILTISVAGSKSTCAFPFTVTDLIRFPSGCRSRITISRGAWRFGGSISASIKPSSACEVIL